MSLLAMQREFGNRLKDAEPGAQGFAIYHNAYRAQLADCLADTFEQTLAWIGGEAFGEAARAHIDRVPPSGWTMGAYGVGFDDTLSELYPEDPEVAELASLEWQLAQAFAGVDSLALPVTKIATIDWDRASLKLVPTVSIMPARTNAGAIWSALSHGEPPPAATLLPEPASMLVWRQGFTPCFRTIEKIEHDALALIATGASFVDLCAMLIGASSEEEGVALAGAMLAQWFTDDLIAEVI